ncbi:hypothetical protein E2C01_087471 [Portunus trituberculatus]|uniref:Uncharacterized protein n=1 Tax=Portunus trituberculatus TaxID=210409 RepID=A0A5B7JDG1_PORTR|nr:hypothetical protein [Portunus trituberculatus]
MQEEIQEQEGSFNPFSTGTHFYLEICVRLDHFIDIRKSLRRSEINAFFTILTPMSF